MANDVTGRNHEDAVHCFALSKEDDHVVSASGGKVTLFDTSTFKVFVFLFCSVVLVINLPH